MRLPPVAPPPPARRVDRAAWLMLGGAFTAFTVSAVFMHSYPVYLVAFIGEFGWSRAETSLAYSVSQIVAGVSAPLVGFLVDRLGLTRLLLLGGGLLVVGLLGSAFITELWQTVVLYGLTMTIGANCLGLVVFVPILSRYFIQQRGMAISILQSGNGMGRGISAPLVQSLISLIGWRGALLVQAGLTCALILPLAALFPQIEPRSTGQETRVPTDDPPAGSLSFGQDPGWTLDEAVRTSHFWLLLLVYLFTGLGSYFVSLHQVAFATDVGFGKLYAAEVLGMGAILALPGTVIIGILSDHIGREWSAILAYAISIVGVVCALFISGPDQKLLLWLHACFFGVTWGARAPAITAKTADLFPGARLGTILGVVTIGSGVGNAPGSWGAGFVFDLTGSYRIAFLLSIASYAGGVVAFLALRRPLAPRVAVPPSPPLPVLPITDRGSGSR